MNNSRDAVIVAYGRSPMAKAHKGSFVNLHPVEYAAQTLTGVIRKLPGVDLNSIDDVMVGCATPEGECFYNVARLIAQRAGLPDSIPGQTINRFCSSGLQAISTAANAIMAGQMDIVIAGGVERMTGMNMKSTDPRFIDHALEQMKPDTYLPMGLTAENVAEMYNISRQEMDQMAADSHAKAFAAQKTGKFTDEIIPIKAVINGEERIITEDEGIRPETTVETLSTLKPCFKKDGKVTAATSSQMTDAAAFVVIMARETAEKLGYIPLAKFVGFAAAGVPAGVMGLGPIAAVPKVMEKSGLSISDMDVIELNEAFASQAIACIRDLNIPMEKVNPNGGAMALGHPLGATGAFLACKVINELKRTNGKYGLITMCIGGGQGAAGILELEYNE